MFRRPRPEEVEERPVFTKGERIGGAIAHGTPLLVGLPLVLITPLVGGDPFMALLPCPIVAYVISRSFRRKQSVWGSFQAMQAALVQMILIVLAFVFIHMSGSLVPQFEAAAFVLTFLLFLYTMWGAWDTAWGYDFRYIFISNFVDRITAANLRRQEARDQRRETSNRLDPPPRFRS
ncbi:MAG: hypothetical protein F4X65_14200 [Chloroflexi bacterium]|nr:hypothetical protein [Chloroflexota bacterium]